jgi:hypothetical protein
MGMPIAMKFGGYYRDMSGITNLLWNGTRGEMTVRTAIQTWDFL